MNDDVRKRIGLNLRPGRSCGSFTEKQETYLEYHRNKVFEQRYKIAIDPIDDLMDDLPGVIGHL